VERCGHCDNCARLAAEPVERLPEPVAAPRLIEVRRPVSAFEVGDAVKTPRYGEGVVSGVQGDQVAVRYPDKSTRTFLAAFLKKPRLRRSAPPPHEPVAALA
jgi:ATP-dependent DNA helicase RecQ